MKIAYLLFPFVVGGLVACDGGGNNNGSGLLQNNPFAGVWTSNSDGETYVINADRLQVYQHDSRFCLLQDEFSDLDLSDLTGIFEISADGQSITDPGFNGVLDYHAPPTRYDRVEALPEVCEQPVASTGQAGYRPNPVRDLNLFWQTFDDYYLSFDLKQVDWRDSLQQTLEVVSPDSSDAELFEALYQMITPLADAHVHITSAELGSASVNGKPVIVERLINEYADLNGLSLPIPLEHLQGVNDYIQSQMETGQSIILAYADDAQDIHRAANDLLLWFQVGDIAYLQINAMQGFSDDPEDAAAELDRLEAALDQVMDDIQFSAGLIIDVRGNNGGHDFLSMAIASRFVDSERHVYSKQARAGTGKTALVDVYIEPRGDHQYLKPVALLTSNSTVSAAEVFTLMMRSLPQVTLIGEATQGALSDVLERSLPNGFEFTLSNEFYYSSEGDWFEHTGIPVDIEVPYFTRQQRLDGNDPGIETAFNWLSTH